MAAAEGERKLVTVLFADVVGSTAIAERLDPEDVVEIMNGAFAFMTAAVNRYGGTVERLMGDSVLAFFGARQAHEDDAERAVRAGLEIRDQAARHAERVRARFQVDFQVRVGINTGLVVAGRVGSEHGSEFTTTGDAPNLAARLQAAARPGTVLISASTHRLAAHVLEVKPLGPLEVKGKAAPVEAFEVLAPRAVPERARGLERQGLSSPLVGRDAELQLLDARLDALRSGAGAVVALSGEAGLGKSRLIAEMQARAGEVTWLEGRALSYGQAMPYHVWQPVGRRMIGAADGDDAPTLRRKLRDFAGDRTSPAALQYLEIMLGAGERGPAGSEIPEVAQEVAGAALDLMRAAFTSPHVLVLDDLHWADSASIDLASQVAALALETPLLLLCTLRPHRRTPGWALLDRLRGSLAELYTQIDLAPLDASAARQLLGNLLQVKDMPEAIRQRILDRSEGNPFYLEEVLRSLLDSGHIVAEGDRFRATSEIAGVAIPETLAGVLSARIDRLPEPARRVAQTASVLGREFPQEVLEIMCREAPESERIEHVLPHLLTLTYEELVRRRPDTAKVYKFKHALTRDAAYGLLLRARRRQLHGLAAVILEKELEAGREELAPVVGLHFYEAGGWRKAAHHLAAAARAARRLYALHEEGDHWEHVLRALDQLDDPDPELLYDAVERWMFVHTRLDDLEGTVLGPEPDRAPSPWYLRAEQLARARGDTRQLARLLSWMASAFGQVGRGMLGLDRLHESERLAREVGDDHLLMLPIFVSTLGLLETNPARALEYADQGLALAHEGGDRGIEAHLLALKAVAFARLGRREEARRWIDRTLEAAPRTGSRVKEADAFITVGMAYHDLGEPELAARYARLGAEKAENSNAIECACAGYFALGRAAMAGRHLDEAGAEFQRAISFGRHVQAAGWESYLNRVVGHDAAARLLGGADDLREIEEALERADRAGDGFGVAELSEALAEALLARSRAAEAEPRVASALRYYRDAGVTAYAARALELQAAVLGALDRGAEAARAREELAALRGAPRAETP